MRILQVVILDEWHRVTVRVADKVESRLDVERLGRGHEVLALDLNDAAVLQELGVVAEGYPGRAA